MRRDQRELIKVAQRNFRKYVSMREWGWFVIIQKTRPLVGQPNPEEELRLLEEKANATYGGYKEALDVTENLKGQMDELQADIKSLTKTLEEEQGNLSVYTDRRAKAAQMKAETEGKLATEQQNLAAEEASRIELTAEVKKHSGSIGVVKKDIEDIELAITKVEQEKANRDHTIKTLNDEIGEQDEVINKLNKEKKHIAETQAKSNEDLISADEKVSHLNSIKGKLESTLDELEGALDKEKRSRGNLEKERRKVEGELKMTQESVSDLERVKREIENTYSRKEGDISNLASKLDDEQSLVAKMQKNIKENQGRVGEIEQLGVRLNEAGGATHAQVELNKKRENEVSKLRKDIEENNIQQESILGGLKRKHQDAMQEMTEQIDQLGKMKAKIDKDKSKIINECADARAATDEVMRAQASVDKSNKNLLNTLNDTNKKIANCNLTLGDFEATKRKLAAENADLLRIVGDLDTNFNMLMKVKSSLAGQLEE